MKDRLMNFFDKGLLAHPWIALFFILLLSGISGLKIDQFRLEASADSLVLESDQSLKFYRSMRDVFVSSDDFLVVTYAPHGDLFTESAIHHLRSLRDEIEQLEGVLSTNTILNVPLLHSPTLTLENIEAETKTLDKNPVSMADAKVALLDNPLYRNLLISEDATTTAVQVNLPVDKQFYDLLKQRDALREQARAGSLDEKGQAQLLQVSSEYDGLAEKLNLQQEQVVADIRTILDKYRDQAELHLGGVPMIVADMIDYIESDLATFGVGVLIFLLLTLALIFHRWQWVLLPLLCCLTTVWSVVGLLGWLQWPVTVISSNFISLLLIITLSLTIHIIVRYREYQLSEPSSSNHVLALNTIGAMILPCFYMALTTIVAFGSLTFSGIRPVIDFGWMMTMGITIAFLVTFMLMPVLMMLLPESKPPKKAESKSAITRFLAEFTESHGIKVVWGAAAVAITCVWGISKLTVENSFIDYFKESTEIYQGMVVIDNKIGGTTPLDIIIDDTRSAESAEEVDPFLDDCYLEAECEETEEVRNTWYTYKKMDSVEKVHDYLESLPETGKVLSLATTLKLVQTINQGNKLNAVQVAFLPVFFPESLQSLLILPYINEEQGKARFSVRLIESSENLNREALLKNIRSYLTSELGYKDEHIHFTGMAVLYNNMLQSLFDSQIKTLGAVFIAIMLMFMVLFRSLSLALIGIIPNLLAASIVLGLMGILEIPLDMMTITVAAIAVGIAVDNTIHYIHRFRTEFVKDGDYLATMHRCHRSIGRAMLYTSLTIIIGFSILVLSNFIPTIYFGLFTGLAMAAALAGALTLLPKLLLLFKPKL